MNMSAAVSTQGDNALRYKMNTSIATSTQGIDALCKLLNNASDKMGQDGLRVLTADGCDADAKHALRTEMNMSTATSTQGDNALRSEMNTSMATSTQGNDALRKFTTSWDGRRIEGGSGGSLGIVSGSYGGVVGNGSERVAGSDSGGVCDGAAAQVPFSLRRRRDDDVHNLFVAQRCTTSGGIAGSFCMSP
jgi:hypothetical protein